MLTGSRMALVTVWWFVSARKWFKGPVVRQILLLKLLPFIIILTHG
jgi:hypothetical protein